MSTDAKRAMKAGLVAFLIVIVLAALLLTTTSCGLIPQKQARHPETNAPLWVDAETGQWEEAKHDPKTGEAREPAMEHDADATVAAVKTATRTVTGFIPPPWDGLAYIVLTGGGTAIAWFLRRENKKKRELAGVGAELVMSVENNSTAKTALKQSNGHSATTRAFVQQVTKQPTPEIVAGKKLLDKQQEKAEKRLAKYENKTADSTK